MDITSEAQQRWKSYSGCIEQQCARPGPHLTSAHIWPGGTYMGLRGLSLLGTFLIFSFLSEGDGYTSLSLHPQLFWGAGRCAMRRMGWGGDGVCNSCSAQLFTEDFTIGSFLHRREDLYELIFKEELYIEFTFWSVGVFHLSLARRYQ